MRRKKREKRPDDESLDYKQRKAAFYLAAYSWPKSKVAKEIGVSVRLLNAWLTTEEFNAEVDEQVKKLSGIDKAFRLDRAKKALPFLYDELLRRLAIDEDEIQDVPLRDIVRILQSMQSEIRLDTPGEMTQKVGRYDLGTLSKRYMESTSGTANTNRPNRRKKKPGKVMDIKEVRERYDRKKKKRNGGEDCGQEAAKS